MPPAFTASLLVVLVALLLVVVFAGLPRRLRMTIRAARVHCPRARRSVLVRYLDDTEGNPVGLVSCSAFADRSINNCERECLRSPALAAAPPSAKTAD